MRLSFALTCLIFTISLVNADYDPAQALEYVYASALAYCDPDQVTSWNCGDACKNLTGYQPYYSNSFRVGIDQNLTFSMIVNPTSKKFITVFRGTIGNLQFLSEILQEEPVPYELVNITGAKVLKYFYTHYVTDLRPTVVQKLDAAYASYPDFTYIFTGHSLGAALTTHAAFDTVSSGKIPKEQILVYNYGSPRVGNYDFAQAVMAALPVLYRVTHWTDLVPHVPPCVRNSSGYCVNTSAEASLIWPAWHVSHQIFYDKPSDSYLTCVGDEDKKCADQFELVDTNMAEHQYYLTVYMDCGPDSLVKDVNLSSEKATLEMQFEAQFAGWW